MPLIKRNDSKAVAHVLSEDEKQAIRDKKRDGITKKDLLVWARSEFANKNNKREAAARMIEHLFLKAN